MSLGGGEIVDASRTGGLTRFLNHSCEPNVTVDGCPNVQMVALRDIAEGEELACSYVGAHLLRRPLAARRAHLRQLYGPLTRTNVVISSVTDRGSQISEDLGSLKT